MPKLVLVVEDDDAIGQTMCQLLESEGITCQWTSTRDEAVDYMKDVRPDLILLDHLGHEECQAVVKAAKACDPEAPIILVTARHKPEELASQLGLPLPIIKPFSVEDLIHRVRDVIGEDAKEEVTVNHVHTIVEGDCIKDHKGRMKIAAEKLKGA